MITEQIGKNIKTLRDGRRMSQQDLASKVSVAQPTIHYALKRLKISYKKNTKTP